MRINKSQLAIGGLLLLFALLSWLAAARESAVYDEPLHIASSLAVKQLGDFRVDSEDPAMFKQWLVLLQPDRPISTKGPFWDSIGHEAPSQWAWSTLTVFNQPPEMAMAEIDRARLSMLLLGVALGALIATWAWQLGGPAAGIIAAAVFSLDPNFIAHAPLAKNDVAAALGFAATAFALWHVGRGVTWMRLVALAIAVAATVTFKFSGVLLAAVVPAVLVVRALMRAHWPVSLLPRPGGERAGVRGETLTGEKVSSAESNSNSKKHGQRTSTAQPDKTTTVSPLTPALSPLGRGRRVLLAVSITALVGAFSFVAIWASYGFRYAPSPDPTYTLDVASQSPESSPLRTIDRLHLLPQSYTFGLAYTLSSAVHRNGFLLGRTSDTGWWYYFPFAMAVKTPLATIGLFGFALAILVKKILHARRMFAPSAWRSDPSASENESAKRRWGKLPSTPVAVRPDSGIRSHSDRREGQKEAGLEALIREDQTEASLKKLIRTEADALDRDAIEKHCRFHQRQWAAICLVLPAAIYLAMAMRSNLNIGLRHVLPIYPLAFVAMAVVVAKYRRAATVLLVLLAIESAVAFPDELAYFNLAAGGSRGGIRLLSDSNLDWGQGLKRLADWQAEHPREKLYLSYFGTADPGSYGVDYTNAGAGYAFGLPPVMPESPGVIAVSATHLQGQYVADRLKPFYESLRQTTPREVLGGSIYLYDWPLKK